jgi:hypothetical protein
MMRNRGAFRSCTGPRGAKPEEAKERTLADCSKDGSAVQVGPGRASGSVYVGPSRPREGCDPGFPSSDGRLHVAPKGNREGINVAGRCRFSPNHVTDSNPNERKASTARALGTRCFWPRSPLGFPRNERHQMH